MAGDLIHCGLTYQEGNCDAISVDFAYYQAGGVRLTWGVNANAGGCGSGDSL
jgi:hypothetical protein